MATVTQSPATESKWAPEDAINTSNTEHDSLLLLRLSAEVDQTLDMLMARTSLSKADVINMALGLLRATLEAIDQGKRVGIADADTELDTEFVGL